MHRRQAESTFLSIIAEERSATIACPFPPRREQTAIAAFLDRETAKIDELVAEQRRLIELLKEKRQAVISHAVTKGLNPCPHEALRHRMARRRAGALGNLSVEKSF